MDNWKREEGERREPEDFSPLEEEDGEEEGMRPVPRAHGRGILEAEQVARSRITAASWKALGQAYTNWCKPGGMERRLCKMT